MVVVERFSFVHEAHIAKANLESAGIHCYLADEFTVNTQWLYSNAIGGVRLMVEEKDIESARVLLGSDFSDALEEQIPPYDNEHEHCAYCGSHDVVTYTKGKRPAFLMFIVLGFPLFTYQHGYKCNQCGKFSEEL